MTGCVPLAGGYLCGAGPHLAKRRIITCPTEGRRRRAVQVFGGAWYSDRLTCLGCGDSWSDGERGVRPFARGWRAESIRRARKDWGRAVPAAEYRRHVDAAMREAVAA